jgi:hypothetical protein
MLRFVSGMGQSPGRLRLVDLNADLYFETVAKPLCQSKRQVLSVLSEWKSHLKNKVAEETQINTTSKKVLLRWTDLMPSRKNL